MSLARFPKWNTIYGELVRGLRKLFWYLISKY